MLRQKAVFLLVPAYLGCPETKAVKQLLLLLFSSVFFCNNPYKDNSIKENYVTTRRRFCGLPLSDDHSIDTELVSNIAWDLTHGKALNINSLSAEHLYYSHPSLCHFIKTVSTYVNVLLCSIWI